MPRAFTDTERAAIRERLLAAGKDLFARRGIRATTVEQLARAAGISKGAFYLFYPSKEALFFAIVEEVETAMQARLERQVAAAPHDALRLLLRASLQARDENPLFDVAISEEAVAVMRTMSPEDQEAFLRRDVEMTAAIAAHLAAAGADIAVSPRSSPASCGRWCSSACTARTSAATWLRPWRTSSSRAWRRRWPAAGALRERSAARPAPGARS